MQMVLNAAQTAMHAMMERTEPIDARCYLELCATLEQAQNGVTPSRFPSEFARQLAMCIGSPFDADLDNPENWNTLDTLANDIFRTVADTSDTRRLWRSMVQMITPEHREAVKASLVWLGWN